MPFRSRAQLRKFAALVKQGKLKQATFDEWLAKTDTKKLPERLKPKKRPAKKKGVKRAATKNTGIRRRRKARQAR